MKSTEFTNLMVRLSKIDSGMEAYGKEMKEGFRRDAEAHATMNDHLKTLNGQVAKHSDLLLIHTEAIVRIDALNEIHDKIANKKILTTQNIITAAAVLIAFLTYYFK